jgi:hypothetical protein
MVNLLDKFNGVINYLVLVEGYGEIFGYGNVGIRPSLNEYYWRVDGPQLKGKDEVASF